ncbi:RNA-binding S4 domain-containing protein [Conexibacter sp. JD483]|uniref:RNA-binding S4 domain-containing protein n=1 Tax=unclassified Conexibacter TaxID=2627773 RepID=UPI002719641D|nr:MULTISPECIES: RNA-binding S4 domain-containing protein [unclassified Conexibacter]MDO8188725.1 RNA-binding S4 domain-containing protein [Conexibacter sp. CPCC 205706]MDO8201252.1 RNA-binding S4 domain-containing protein [Conexibacter sp. CPCC 205762]MDR9370940.1 RNA-binding S4 domain-containing protein [Conexibacter sp. JD483]
MESLESMRVDRWLWVARLVKTRAIGAEAVKAGRVKVNDVQVKPAKEVRAGDRLELRNGELRIAVVIRGVAKMRGSARVAAVLYDETEESVELRERLALERRMAALGQQHDGGGRPTKRDRRRFEQARERDFQ